MSFNLVNGKLVPKVPDGKLDAPTPSQIAERAYEMATEAALCAVALNPAPDAATVRAFILAKRPVDLAELRESVINPGVVPWWRNR